MNSDKRKQKLSIKIYTQKEFADAIGVSKRTLARWDEDGKFKARRNPSGKPFYTEEDLIKYMEGF